MHYLVIRQSSFGDVLLAHPVLAEVTRKYPKVKFTFLSNPIYKPFFENIDNLTYFGANTKKEYKGPSGIFKLKKDLINANSFDGIIDLHNVLRSRVLSKLLRIKTYRIQKGRQEKRALTRRYSKAFNALKHTTQRYADVFSSAGLPVEIKQLSKELNNDKKSATTAYLDEKFAKSKASKEFKQFIASEKKKYKIFLAISPFSLQKMKCLPKKTMIELINVLKENISTRIYLIGAPGEKKDIEAFAKGSNILNVAGKFTFYDEIALFHNLDLLITMDSANLHLAGLCNTRNLSIWGPTHPYSGFSPITTQSYLLQRDDLNCRPCSIYGNKPCYRKDFACMNGIKAADIVKKIESILKK